VTNPADYFPPPLWILAQRQHRKKLIQPRLCCFIVTKQRRWRTDREQTLTARNEQPTAAGLGGD
jgi:hypothetical protein